MATEYAGKLTVAKLEQLITSGLKGRYLVNPDVTVSIKEHRPFYVDGEVKKPGGYSYHPALTVRKAVALAGGFTEWASRKNIKIIRSTDPSRSLLIITSRSGLRSRFRKIG